MFVTQFPDSSFLTHPRIVFGSGICDWSRPRTGLDPFLLSQNYKSTNPGYPVTKIRPRRIRRVGETGSGAKGIGTYIYALNQISPTRPANTSKDRCGVEAVEVDTLIFLLNI